MLVALVLLASGAAAQEAPPLFEARGAWVGVVYRLDWPPYSADLTEDRLREVQQQFLTDIFDDLEARGLNTVMFQVVFHGTAAYDSERLPWSYVLTDEAGRDPGWDPLAFAVEEAHARGMELHTWFNVFQMGNTNTPLPESGLQHVRDAHPEWVEAYMEGGEVRDYWINPAFPEARDWLVGHVVEIVEGYDVDGIHFDYIRYPSGGFDDDFMTKPDYPNGQLLIADWRRENVNLFVEAAYDTVKTLKPWVKVGSAPIGLYQKYTGAPPGFWAYDDVFQDSRAWLERGIHDYITPQLYFSIGTDVDAHDFDRWVTDYTANDFGRHIYAGLGTWKEAQSTFPGGEIADEIALSRTRGAEGQVHFRYQFVERVGLRGQYDAPALAPPMPFLDAAQAPAAPEGLAITWDEAADSIRIAWRPAEAAASDPVARYALFRAEGEAPDAQDARQIAAVLGAADTTFSEPVDAAAGRVYYRVVAQSQLGMASAPSAAVHTGMTPLSTDAPGPGPRSGIESVYPHPAAGSVTIDYAVREAGPVRFALYDVLGRAVWRQPAAPHAPGQHRTTLPAADLAPGTYVLVVDAPDGRYTRRLAVVR